MTFYLNPIGSKQVQVKINFPDLVDPEATDAASILKLIETLFKYYNIDFYQKLVGFGSDVASVNTGKNNDLETWL